MMHSPAAAIAWEIWRKNRWALSLVAAAIPLSFPIWSLVGAAIPEATQIFEFFAILLSMATVFWAFSFTEMDARGRHSGFPSRMFVLPVRTVKLVSYPALYGTGVILLLYSLWLGAISMQWKVKIPSETILCQLSVLAAMMMSMQAIAWALHRFNLTRMLLLGVSGSVLGCGGLLCLDEQQMFSRKALTIVAGAAVIVSYVGALVAVEHDRRGELLGWLGRVYERIIDLFPWRQKPFASGAPAQFWIEMRRRGWP